MIKQCRRGKIDMIITKSISRFARNTADVLKYVRMLKEIGVDIFFEEQNISTTAIFCGASSGRRTHAIQVLICAKRLPN